ncbi:solute carrier family 25 member 45 isoform X1 [Lutzomyia longipalpis]|uniref:solute carrier family 25 member 45 isoform X1 n=2 Tax=Lutzomyia longipalpis TaxID=7200 RepID=UPI002484009B|nr:solute carrier family 25 member 45 isoform X1 [Lutzomyia longipalpis]
MKLVYCDFLAGCFGGTCGMLVGYPLDTIKCWQQASNCRVGTAIYNIIVMNNGLKGFYRGMTFPVLTTGLLNSMLFGIYGNTLRNLQLGVADEKLRKKLQPQHIFIAGSVGGFLQAFVANPIELVKIRLQTRSCTTRGSWECLRNILQIEGFLGLYRGLTPMICRDIFPYGIYMLAYEQILNMLGCLPYVQEKRQQNAAKKLTSVNSNLELTLTTIAGSIAGVLSWIVVIPFDVIKTIMQAEPNPHVYRNMIHCIKVHVERSGWTSLFRGSCMLLVRAVPVNVATFIGYEYYLEQCKKTIS